MQVGRTVFVRGQVKTPVFFCGSCGRWISFWGEYGKEYRCPTHGTVLGVEPAGPDAEDVSQYSTYDLERLIDAMIEDDISAREVGDIEAEERAKRIGHLAAKELRYRNSL